MPQLQSVPLVAPGSRGLNKEKEFNLLSPIWATEAINCIITEGGRLGARNGWINQTSTGITGDHSIDVLFEYIQKDGDKFIISAANNTIYQNIDDFSLAANDITPTSTPTADNWKFINFNDLVLGYQKGHTPIQWDGTSDFTDQSFTGTGPDGNTALAAFGRIWAADADLQTVRYSALLNHDDFSTDNGGGVIDMSSVWTRGMDEIVAIEALGSNLIVFGRNHIIIWGDDSGSEIGINPLNLYVVDTIEGTGCIARDSVQAIGEGDMWFLSRHGLQSLKRVIQDKNNPLVQITKNIRTQLQTDISTQRASDTNFDQVRSVHHPEERMYLLLLPAANKILYVNTAYPFQDEDGDEVYPITEWDMGGDPRSFLSRQDGDLLIGSSGVVGKYTDHTDNQEAYQLSFWTGYLDLAELNQYLKMLKEVSAIVQIGGSGTVAYRWDFDFQQDVQSYSIFYTNAGQSEYNNAEFNEDEYSGGVTLERKNFPGVGQGQFMRVGASISINGFGFILQQLQLTPAVGRRVV